MKLQFSTDRPRERRRALPALATLAAFTLLIGCQPAGVAGEDLLPEDAHDGANGDEVAPPEPAPAELRFGSTAEQALACQQRIDQELLDAAAAARADTAGAQRFRAGENPAVAVERGWPVQVGEFMHESLLPCSRIVAYYGNPLVGRMGVLGEYPKEEMLSRLRRQVAEWEAADPQTPVVPALHMVAIVAQQDAGTSGHYRTIMRDTLIEMVHSWAREVDGIFFVDIQVGTQDIRELLPRMEHFLVHPDVHLGIDPEFMMKDGSVPGRRIGTMDADDINYASEYLANLVREHNLPPKVFVVHRFTRNMVTNTQNIQLRPEVQIVMHMDGWGRPFLKRDTFHRFVKAEPVEYVGFKVFYHHDTREDPRVMSPEEILRLWPKSLYIQYQ